MQRPQRDIYYKIEITKGVTMITKNKLILPGFTNIETSSLPVLREKSEHKKVELDASIPKHLAEGLGKYTGFRVLPYKMQNHYSRSKELNELNTIEYENEKIRAIFLPDFGGRLYSLYNKELKKELLYTNSVFQPANLAIRNAWFSGGIEWNFGHYGHAFSTCSPVFFSKCINNQGEEFLRMYEYESVKKIFFQIDFYLPQNADYLVTYTKIINPYNQPTPLYYWSNIAVSEMNKARVFSGTNEVLYFKPYINKKGAMVNTMAHGYLPNLDGIDGDVSYPRNFERSNEYFFQTKETEKYPWEAVGYNDGSLFYEFSTMPLRYRKMFCWGTHKGGTKWQDYLSHKAEDKYLEIQAGVYPTQLHSEEISPNSTVEFMQLFGMSKQSQSDGFYQELDLSSNYVKDIIFAKHKLDDLHNLEKHMQQQSEISIDQILHYGSGWGKLELLRLEKEENYISLKSMCFPQESLGEEQEYWLSILNEDLTCLMGSGNHYENNVSYLIDKAWLEYIDKAIEASMVDNEFHILNKALILSENQCDEMALKLLLNHVNNKKSALYLRTVGALYNKLENYDKALCYYKKAYEKLDQIGIKDFEIDFMGEYFQLLFQCEKHNEIWNIYMTRKKEAKINSEEMYFIIAQTAFVLEEWEVLEEAFTIHPERIREGDNILCELWFKKKALEVEGMSLEEVRKQYTPPQNIDFRMT